MDDQTLPPPANYPAKTVTIPQGFIIGADISSVQAAEDRGMVYTDKGVPKDIFEILKSHGFNYIRLRIFVNPSNQGGYSPGVGYCDLAHTIVMAKRVKAAGMGLLIDFHYSDTWADPGKQTKPLAWRDLALPDLEKAVYDYTKDAITQLKAAGAEPDMVQVGNEITPGMLLNRLPAARGGQGAVVSTQPEGSTKNWDNLAALLKAGIAGVKDVDPKILIMLHIDKGATFVTSAKWVDNALSRGVQFDILGESCYDTFQGPPQKIRAAFEQLVQRYPNLSFINDEYGGGPADANNNLVDRNGNIVERNPYPTNNGLDWTKRESNDVVFNLPGGKGLGTFIWEPTESGNYQQLFGPDGATLPDINQYDQMAKDYASRKPQ